MKLLRKLFISSLAIMLATFCLFSTACASTPSVSGKTYGFYSVEMSTSNINIEYNLGDNLDGTVLTPEYILMVFYKDGTCETYAEGELVESSTWVQNGSTITITPETSEDSDPYEIKVRGKSLILKETETDPEMGTLTSKITLKEYVESPSTSVSA